VSGSINIHSYMYKDWFFNSKIAIIMLQ